MFRNYVDVLGKLSSQLIITWLEKRWKQRHPYDDSGVFSQTTSKETKIRNISGVLATLGGKANAITHNFAISPLLKKILPRKTIPSAALNGRLYSPVFCERHCSIDDSAMKCW
ncbi:hypothetical protein T10_13690 [Trichinella papuae]|uniref:Uncharacterized protein n=1 Tax=Trichinella papuae TaxID=268474 RepID=A0A0V1M0P6_9BILA|nr:hypothetical protein T10_13690 [Trichinella papuae]